MQVKIRVLPLAGAAGLAAVLAGCAAPPYGPNYPVPYGAPPPPATNATVAPAAGTVEYGRITNVALISSGAPVATGNDPAGGNRASNSGGPIYRVWVQTDSGVLRAFDVSAMGNLRPGDRVRIENGLIYLS